MKAYTIRFNKDIALEDLSMVRKLTGLNIVYSYGNNSAIFVAKINRQRAATIGTSFLSLGYKLIEVMEDSI